MIGQGREAKIKYADGHFDIISPGQYVICAVTGRRIEIGNLRYWSVPLQEAYFDNQAALERHDVSE